MLPTKKIPIADHKIVKNKLLTVNNTLTIIYTQKEYYLNPLAKLNNSIQLHNTINPVIMRKGNILLEIT